MTAASGEMFVWVFNGVDSRFPSGVYSSRDLAERWITENKLTGTLTRFPIDISIFEWCISRGEFAPTKDSDGTPEFIGRFSSASQEHYHYENGSLG